jgi:signal transduction histidine kinase
MQKRWSVQTCLWLLTLAVAVPLAVVLAYSILNDVRQDERQIRIATLNLAQLVASQSQQFLADAEKVALRLSQHPIIQALDPNQRDPALDHFLDLHPQFADLVVCDADGRTLHSARGEVSGSPRADWVGEVIKTGRLTVGKPVADSTSGRWFSVLGYPVRGASGQIGGALGISVDLGRFRASVSPVSLPPDSTITIIDREGTVMMRSPGSQSWMAKNARGLEIVDYALTHVEGELVGKGMDGEARIYGFASIPRSGWRVYVGIPAEFAFASARENVLRAGLMGTALMALAIALVLFLGRQITQPMQALFRAATAAAGGRLESPVPTTGPAEIAAVAEEFNRMIAIRTQTELEIRKLNTELEKRVAERTAALAQRSTQLESANRELEAFSYSVSHDLRAPLRSIDGFTKALLEDYARTLDSTGKDYLERVRGATQRMSGLIDELLKLSRISRAELHRRPVNLSTWAEEIARDLRTAQPERKANFTIQPGLIAQGSPELLRALLQNLLNNAWKFTRNRDPAQIEFGTQNANGQAIYFVRDNGAGFDMAYVDKLFGAFQRLHSVEEYEGTGIGLATVQRIVHRHGGRVWAEGKLDQGATFYFTLPAIEH